MIKRLIQLILDQQSARTLEKEIDRSMRKIAQESESRMKAAFKRIGGYVAAAFGIRAIVGFTKEMFRLGSAAEETGSKFQTVFGAERAAELDTFLGKFGRLAGLTRTEGREMLANFGAVFQGAGVAADASADLSEKMVRLAADLQSFHNVPIADAFAAIRSGATGEAEPLKRFGIVLRAVDVDARALRNTGKSTTSALTEQERVVARLQLIYEKAGVAVGDLEDTQGSTANRVRSLTTWFRQLKEDLAVGLLPVFRAAVIEIGNSSGFFDGATEGVKRLTVWIQENLGAIVRWGTVLALVLRNGVQNIVQFVRALFNVKEALADVAVLALAELGKLITQGINKIAEGANWLIEQMNRLPGVDIDFRFAGLSIEGYDSLIAASAASLKQNVGDITDAVGSIAQSWVDVYRAATAADEAQRNAAASGRTGTDSEKDFTPLGHGTGDPKDAEALRIQKLTDAKLAADAIAGALHEKELARMAELEERASDTADAMTSAFTTFFEASATGWDGMGGIWAAAVGAAREAGASIVGVLVAGRAEEQVAAGTAALASGTWPPNPAAIAAAFKHFAAAALYRAIPGVIRGGFGGGGRGGGGGGGSLPRGAIGTSVPGTRELPGAEVNIYLDPLSPADPRFQRAVMGATQQAQDRFGPNVKVHVHSRTGG